MEAKYLKARSGGIQAKERLGNQMKQSKKEMCSMAGIKAVFCCMKLITGGGGTYLRKSSRI